MALWTIENDGTNVTLTWEENGVSKPCGNGEASLQEDLLAWVVSQAVLYDSIRTPGGVFFRMPTPAGTN